MTTPQPTTGPAASADVIDTAAGLRPGQRLFAARRFRAAVVQAAQARHDSLVLQPLPGLSVADRLRVAIHVCQASDAGSLAEHYLELLKAAPDATQPSSPVLDAMKHFAATLASQPRPGGSAAVAALKTNRLGDDTIEALAQLVAFLAYQTRVVAGLQALQAEIPTQEPAFNQPAPASGTEREHAVSTFAQAVSLRAHALVAADITPLRRLGFSDEDIIDGLDAAAMAEANHRGLHNPG